MGKHEIEHDLTDEIVCPYCGHEFECSYEYNEGLIECEECGKNFSFYKTISVYYTSNKRPCANNEEPHNWLSMSFEYDGEILFPNLYRCQNCNVNSIFKNETRHHFESFLEEK